MTRLKTEWIEHMPSSMDEYNRMLKDRAGVTLSELICYAYEVSEKEVARARKNISFGVVPITQGEGIIGSFSESIAAIIKSMGFNAAVSPETDVEGIYYLKENGADTIFMADDKRYIALGTRNGRVAENDSCTAWGYINIIRKMAELRNINLSSENILLTGYGRVGKKAALILAKLGIGFDFFDKDDEKKKEILCDFPGTDIRILDSVSQMKEYRVLLDFTNEGGWLKPEYLRDDAVYASPGVPLSLDENAVLWLQNNAVYDNLEIGTAMMLAETIFNAEII